MSRICIGVATKPQALKGQFRVKPQMLNLKLYKKINIVEIGNIEYKVESVTLRDTFVIFKVEGVDTCEQAESLRNKQIFASIDIPVEDHFDLLNYTVMLDSEEIGVITDINNFGSKDILSISGKKEIMVPIVDGLIEKIDEDNKIVLLNKIQFEQVAVYED